MRFDVSLGLTGLRRTGKTVFLTTLIYELTELGSLDLDCFTTQGVSFKPGRLEQSAPGGLDRFPYEEHLNALREPSPRWPPPTTREAGCTVTFQYSDMRPHGYLNSIANWLGYGWSQGEISLHLHDYPGEYLLDVDLLEKDHDQWSAATLTRMRKQVPDAAAKYEQACEQLKHSPMPEALEGLRRAYAEYVLAARETGLEFLQPGMTLVAWYDRLQQEPDAVPKADELPFVPLAGPLAENGPLNAELRTRYVQHIETLVRPFIARLQQSQTQLVLVDVLRILRHVLPAYNDTRQCLTAIISAYRYTQGFFSGGVRRTVFAATKADHATRSHRSNLTQLLDALVNKAQGGIPTGVAIASSEWFTSLQSTEDAVHQYQDKPVEVLRGVKLGTSESEPACWNPGFVPHQWPDGSNGQPPWTHGNALFQFPEFAPRRLPPLDGASLPHMNLDRLLWKALNF